MELKNVMKASSIKIGGSYTSKQEVLKNVAELACNDPILKSEDTNKILDALTERENLSSTGFGNGIAIPHCIMDIPDFVIGAITIPKGVDFKAIDKKPVNIVVFIIAPKNQRDRHIRFLSALSGMLNDKLNRQKLLASNTPEALLGIFLRHTVLSEKTDINDEWNQFTYIVQSEIILDKLLGFLTEIENTHISVTDAYSASHFLYSKPLFSSLWGNNEENYCKIVIVIAPRKISNELLRRSNQLISNNFQEGLVVTVHELTYFNGKLNI